MLKRIFAAIFCLSLLPGCVFGAKKASAQEIPATTDATPRPIVDEALNLVYAPQKIVWDPHRAYSSGEAQLFTGLYEGLASYNPQTLEPMPAAAQSWDISEDGLEYTFHLREKLQFSDGSPLTSLSFYRSFLRFLDPKDPKEYANFLDSVRNAAAYRTGKLTNRDRLGIHAPDPLTLVITLERPTPYFLSILCHHAFTPISQAQLPGLWDNPSRINYSGPYVVQSASEEQLILVKNPFYWDKDSVEIPSIRVSFRKDIEGVSQDFNQYGVDWAVDSFDPQKITIRGGVRMAARFSTDYYFFASADKAFSDPRVRRAIIELMPIETIRSHALIKATGLVPPIRGYPEVTTLQFNPTDAYNLLKEAGYPRGKGLSDLVIAAPYKGEVASTAMQEALSKALDVNVTLVVPEENYYAFVKRERPTLASFSWIGDYLDPSAFLNMWTTDSPLNFSNFREPSYDALLAKSDSQNGLERFQTLSDAESFLLVKGGVIPINHSPSFNLLDVKSLSEWYDNPLDVHPFKYMHFNNTSNVPGVTLASFPQDNSDPAENPRDGS